MPPVETTAETSAERVENTVGRIFEAVAGTMDLYAIYLGDALGCYRALADGGALTAGELAARCGMLPRYAREWCEAQAASGYLECQNPELGPDDRRFALDSALAGVFLDPESLEHLMPAVRCTMVAGRALPELVKTYRGERTYGWEDQGPEMREGQAAANRPAFTQLLASEWLTALPELHARLGAPDSQARVAEVGCGFGWASIALGRTYPNLRVDGFDIDAPSISAARGLAEDAGLEGRVAFHVADISDHDGPLGYDAVFAFECVHDMSRPVEALASMRRMVADDGHVIIVDERTEDVFTPNAPLLERVLYGYSLTVCLPDCMSSQPSAETGTVMRPDTLREYADAAGFASCEVLDIEHDQFRFYRLGG